VIAIADPIILREQSVPKSRSCSCPQYPNTIQSKMVCRVASEAKRLSDGQSSAECVQRAEQLSQYLETNWLELLAGREGFLTEKQWRALDSHEVLWGAMVSSNPNPIVNVHKWNTFDWGSWVRTSIESQEPRIDLTSSTQPMKFPDRISVLYKLVERPTYESTCLRMEAWVLSHQHRRVAAKCFDDTVIYDYTSGKRSVLKPFMVDKLQHTFELQKMCKTKYTEEASKAITAVEEIKTVFQ
ncbi:hypothetical protein ANOM_005695, partial [Aspergillus nomiae NRRL 13137]